uniref:AMP-dependent synthetase/ligase domain-containing protein n=1 Tax=Branchiostoma floridae TaxID=7739 RepID=C3YB55_BRAFL|eukprot:XP_002606507.1 hypothetical protein BRAFLDRAFT_126442 [Branchiostoma floridae]
MEVVWHHELHQESHRLPAGGRNLWTTVGRHGSELARHSSANRLSAGLKAIGTERGDVVAWLVGHHPEWIYLYFAVAKLGAIVLPLQAHRVGRSDEAMTYSLKKAGVKVLVIGDITGVDQTDDTVPYLCSLFPEVKTAKPGNLQIKRIGTYSMNEVLTMGSDAKLIAEVTALQDQLDCHDPFQLVFTSDMIIRNASNVYPSVIEVPITKHPKVKDVRVVSVPDPASVEEICACIILKEGQTTDPEEMKTYCVKIGMVPIELPGYFIFLDEFPVTTTMQKVDRKKLRLIAMEKLGLPKES